MEEETKKEEIQAEKADKKDGTEKPVDKMTAPELREIAKEIPGVTGVHAMKKDELLAIVKEARGIKDEEPAKKRAKKAVKVDLSVTELKKKIAEFKTQKGAAIGEKDKKKTNILRRRINRAKKMTRKAAHV